MIVVNTAERSIFMKRNFICGFIGLGLIGGSIARALRSFYPECYIMAYDLNQEALMLAAADHVIDLPLSGITKDYSRCDYIFLCAPVSANDKNLLELNNFFDLFFPIYKRKYGSNLVFL